MSHTHTHLRTGLLVAVERQVNLTFMMVVMFLNNENRMGFRNTLVLPIWNKAI